MNPRLLLTLLLIVCGAAAFHARAESGLYLGGGIGQATFKDSTSSGQFDSDNAAYKAFVGYRLGALPFLDLAVEGGYTDFGKPSQDLGGQHAEFKLHGPYAAALVIFPLGPIDLYGKAGAINAKTETRVGSTSSSRSGTDGFFGAGVGLRIWKIGLRAEYERYQVRDIDRVQMFSVSALFQF